MLTSTVTARTAPNHPDVLLFVRDKKKIHIVVPLLRVNNTWTSYITFLWCVMNFILYTPLASAVKKKVIWTELNLTEFLNKHKGKLQVLTSPIHFFRMLQILTLFLENMTAGNDSLQSMKRRNDQSRIFYTVSRKIMFWWMTVHPNQTISCNGDKNRKTQKKECYLFSQSFREEVVHSLKPAISITIMH